jgi:hypothetical protein
LEGECRIDQPAGTKEQARKFWKVNPFMIIDIVNMTTKKGIYARFMAKDRRILPYGFYQEWLRPRRYKLHSRMARTGCVRKGINS